MQIIIFDGYAVVADRIHSVVETGRLSQGKAVEFADLTAFGVAYDANTDVSGREAEYAKHVREMSAENEALRAQLLAADTARQLAELDAEQWRPRVRPALRATHGTIDAGEAVFASKEDAPSVTAGAVPPPPQAGETVMWAFPPPAARRSSPSFQVRGGWCPHNSGLSTSFELHGGLFGDGGLFGGSALQVSYGVPSKLQPGADEQFDPAAPVSSAEKGKPVATSDEDEAEDGREWQRGGKAAAESWRADGEVPDHVYADSAEAHDAAATGTQIAPIAAETYAAKAADMDGDEVARLLKVAAPAMIYSVPLPGALDALQNERGGAMPEPVAAKRSDSRTPPGQDQVKAILQEDWPNDVPTADIVARIRKEVPSYPVALLTVKRLGTDAARWGNRRSGAYRASLCATGGGRKNEAGAGEKEPRPALRAISPDESHASIGSTHVNGVGEEVRRSDNLVRTASMGRAEPAKPGVPAIGRAEPASIPFVAPLSASPGARKHGIRVMALSDEGMTDGEIANDINNSCGANDRVNTALVKSIRIEMERIARHDR